MKAVRDILVAVGENPDRAGLIETPKRVANMYEEMFCGLHEDANQHLKMFDEQFLIRLIYLLLALYNHFHKEMYLLQ